jgi:hypothetical protein
MRYFRKKIKECEYGRSCVSDGINIKRYEVALEDEEFCVVNHGNLSKRLL